MRLRSLMLGLALASLPQPTADNGVPTPSPDFAAPPLPGERPSKKQRGTSSWKPPRKTKGRSSASRKRGKRRRARQRRK